VQRNFKKLIVVFFFVAEEAEMAAKEGEGRANFFVGGEEEEDLQELAELQRQDSFVDSVTYGNTFGTNERRKRLR